MVAMEVPRAMERIERETRMVDVDGTGTMMMLICCEVAMTKY